jgi:hypothetical protein
MTEKLRREGRVLRVQAPGAGAHAPTNERGLTYPSDGIVHSRGVLLVTAFFRLSDRPVDEAEQFRRFEQLVASGLPTLLFLDERLADRALAYPNVRVVRMTLGELGPFKWTEGLYLKLPTHRTREKDTREFLLLQNSKLELLERATQHDATASHFAWIDFGIMKVARDPGTFLERLRALAPPLSCVLAPGCWSREEADRAGGGEVN